VTSTLAERVLAGDTRAVARAISLIEDDDPAGADLIRAVFAHTGRAFLIGVTGPPGAGKSTLVDRMLAETRRAGSTAAVIAVDPTSPFTGGAVLGDRLRMQSHAGDDGVFIRSMATRGQLGGLARATADTALVLDASGREVIVIETVGVGQDEVEIVRTADVSVLTLVPGTGDDVQALKAGIMEIADIFVINKADNDGADRLVSSVESNLSLHAYGGGDWRPPIIKTVATTGEGVPALMDAISRFREHARQAGGGRQRTREVSRLREIMSEQLMARLDRVLGSGELAAMAERVAVREIDPYTAADRLLKSVFGDLPGPRP
jgi:LAO/AO transport system kinase